MTWIYSAHSFPGLCGLICLFWGNLVEAVCFKSVIKYKFQVRIKKENEGILYIIIGYTFGRGLKKNCPRPNSVTWMTEYLSPYIIIKRIYFRRREHSDQDLSKSQPPPFCPPRHPQQPFEFGADTPPYTTVNKKLHNRLEGRSQISCDFITTFYN